MKRHLALFLAFALLPASGNAQDDGKSLVDPHLEAPSHRGLAEDPAIEAGLLWLARHQHEDGSWNASNFSACCKTSVCEGKGWRDSDTGVTGLALLAFLQAGCTHLTAWKVRDQVLDREVCFGDAVRNALRWLIKNQDSDGCIGGQSGGKYMYGHAICALALAEAFDRTKADLFGDPAQNAIDFLVAAQNPYNGWRYSKRCGDNDTSVTGWCLMAMDAGRRAGLKIEGRKKQTPFQGALAWFDEVTDPKTFTAGYTSRRDLHGGGDRAGHMKHPTLTALAVRGRLLCGARADDPAVADGLKLLLADSPRWDMEKKTIDYLYWFYATSALLAAQGADGKDWPEWSKSVTSTLKEWQASPKDNCACGSWYAIDPWSPVGGRVYATAVNVLTLEACIGGGKSGNEAGAPSGHPGASPAPK
ncbi:MAG: terpene cyclase/mutase family protein [Planctomycetes bacterium]|nr:terpene cyclase/mutase family protein [Planctomycetota bacterium]